MSVRERRVGNQPPLIHRRGAWPIVAGVLSPRVCVDLIWITFNFGLPERALLQVLKTHVSNLRVLCRHPEDGPTTIRLADYLAWQRAGLGPIFGLRCSILEDMEPPPGPLHAKAVVGREGETHFGIIGSFNLSSAALSRNTESAVELDEAEAAALWTEAEDLLNSGFASELTEEDCVDEDGEHRRPPPPPGGVLVKPPRGQRTRCGELPTRPAPPAPDAACRPAALGVLRFALEDLMHKWPGLEHPSQGWQLAAFERFLKQSVRSCDVLYLPVAVGKTFIALRWLLEQFNEADIRGGRRGKFMTPNEWVMRSVQSDVSVVVEHAKRLRTTLCAPEDIDALASQCLEVVRPTDLLDSASQQAVKALVADECHNWNSGVPTGRYTSIVDSLRRKGIAILGLSATPCRMDHGRFDVPAFLEAFRRPTSSDAEPLMRLDEAIEKKLVSPFRTIVLVPEAQAEIGVLLRREGVHVSMGDYHLVVLREVWEILRRHSTSLLNGIVAELRKSKRVLVFMPRVAEAGDRFVRLLGLRVEELGGEYFDFRDRSEDISSPLATFQRFRDASAQTGRPAVLVTIERFSEGVSIDDIDTLIMLRPTLSPRVAVQALGRGLRLDRDNPRKVCRILDAVQFVDRLALWDRLPESATPSRHQANNVQTEYSPYYESASRPETSIRPTEQEKFVADHEAFFAPLTPEDWREADRYASIPEREVLPLPPPIQRAIAEKLGIKVPVGPTPRLAKQISKASVGQRAREARAHIIRAIAREQAFAKHATDDRTT